MGYRGRPEPGKISKGLMAIQTTVLFDQPQQEIASLLERYITSACSVEITVGFATPGGLAVLMPALATDPGKLKTLIVGKATRLTFKALDRLVGRGVPAERMFVHLGHSADDPDGPGFCRYRPMLHGKIYLMELPDGRSAAVLGSHNMTSFALAGKNGEASVLLEGPSEDPEFIKIREHIRRCREQAVVYDRSLVEAFTWWASTYADGLRQKIEESDEPGERQQTILVFARASRAAEPRERDTLYFELPAGATQVKTLGIEAHLFVFDQLPRTPDEALQRVRVADVKYSRWCKTIALDRAGGGQQVQANWTVLDRANPVIASTARGFANPHPAENTEQVRVLMFGKVFKRYEYFFDEVRPEWKPVYPARARETRVDGVDWQLVRGLAPNFDERYERMLRARRETSPGSRSFVMVSHRRREISGGR